jgi:hydrogenase expression/formation protein HypD
MKYVDEFREPTAARHYADAIGRITTLPWTIMEICGGQTHSIVRHGIDQMLPDGVTLLHGPGCPVCVTPAGMVDAAIAIALRPNVTFCSFGDMLRVPGEGGSLLAAKARGADVRMVYSPLDALVIARDRPDREVVFFAIGFETTAPTTAMAVLQAEREGLTNFSLLVSHVLVPPAIEALLSDPNNGVQGFLAAGHVCTIMGYREYEPIARRYGIPIVVTGFEPLDLLQGLYMCIRQLEEGRAEVENQYSRSVRRAGNCTAQDILARVFAVQTQRWRGIGEIPASGLGLSSDYASYDALQRFADITVAPEHPGECISGEVLRGLKKPGDCPAFGARCTPEHPLGATMVSSEGACAAYYRYRRPRVENATAAIAASKGSL